MVFKPSAAAQRRLDTLTEARRKWDRVHSLVEMVASQRAGQDVYFQQIRRAAEDVSRVFLAGGFGPLADDAKRMSLITRRGGAPHTKIRAMRDLVASIRGAMDRVEKAVLDAERQLYKD